MKVRELMQELLQMRFDLDTEVLIVREDFTEGDARVWVNVEVHELSGSPHHDNPPLILFFTGEGDAFDVHNDPLASGGE